MWGPCCDMLGRDSHNPAANYSSLCHPSAPLSFFIFFLLFSLIALFHSSMASLSAAVNHESYESLFLSLSGYGLSSFVNSVLPFHFLLLLLYCYASCFFCILIFPLQCHSFFLCFLIIPISKLKFLLFLLFSPRDSHPSFCSYLPLFHFGFVSLWLIHAPLSKIVLIRLRRTSHEVESTSCVG